MNTSDRNALKAAAYTAVWTFIGMFGLAVTGWLNDVIQWATSDSATVVFPDPAVLVKAAVAAVAAGAGFVVAALIRLAQAHGVLPGAPPVYIEKPKGDRGITTLGIVVIVLLVILVLAVAGRL